MECPRWEGWRGTALSSFRLVTPSCCCCCRCHLVDMRMWDRRQVLQLRGLLEEEPDISGLAFSPSGRRLYLGTEEGIAAYDVDVLARRCFAEGAVC